MSSITAESLIPVGNDVYVSLAVRDKHSDPTLRRMGMRVRETLPQHRLLPVTHLRSIIR
jgi:hypothetical protein